VRDEELAIEDRWLLSRLSTVTTDVTEALETYRFADAARTLYDFAWDDFCSFYVEMAKGRLQDPAGRPIAQRVLAYALDTLLRLLHPLMPFITEEIWRLLNQAAPIRGLRDPEPMPDALLIAPWPAVVANRRDEAIEKRFAGFQAVLKALREIRSRQNIASRTPMRFVLRCDGLTGDLLEPMIPYFASMANAEWVGAGPDVQPPPINATYSLSGMDVFVDLAGLIDVAAEIARNEKEAQKLIKLVQGKEGKLANGDFVNGAPPHVVAAEREALAKLQGQLATVESALKSLRGSL